MNNNFLGVWIPLEILTNKELSDKEKIILSIIFNLSIKEGFCYASNRYLSEILNITIGRVSKIINSLKAKNYINLEFKYKKGTKEIIGRKIRIKNEQLIGIVKNNYRYSQHEQKGIVKNDQDIKNKYKKIYNYKAYPQRIYPKGFLETFYTNVEFIGKN